MRFAEHRALRVACAVAMAVALGGCATAIDLKARLMPSTAASSATASSTAAAAGAAAAASAPAATHVAAVADLTPLNPATQRAFDDANRALRAGRSADAERGYRALIQSNPDLGGPHANLGVLLRHAGKLNESAAELEQAVKLDPKQPLYLNQLGVTYRQLGLFDKSREAYEQALSLDADYAAATLNLGILSDLYLGDAKRAGELYERYLVLTPSGDAAVTKWIAELKNRKGAAAAADRKEKT